MSVLFVQCSHKYKEFFQFGTPREGGLYTYSDHMKYDGSYTINVKLCNSTIPPAFRSYSSEGLIYFKSDATEPHGGFQIGYSLVDGKV